MDPTRNRFGVPVAAPDDRSDGADGGALRRPAKMGETRITRRGAIGGGLAALAGVGGLLLFPGQLFASDAVLGDRFTLLLKGPYQKVTVGPDLGLSSVNLSDGSFSTVGIYAVSGIPGPTGSLGASPTSGPAQSPHTIHNVDTPIGAFYVSFTGGNKCAYDLPGGAMAMQFTSVDDVTTRNESDGKGGFNVEGTYELNVIEATGLYRSFAGGHNQMWDRLHLLTPGDGTGGAEEYCFCFITQPVPA